MGRTLTILSSNVSLVQVRLHQGTLHVEANETTTIPLRIMPYLKNNKQNEVFIFINDNMGQTHETFLLKLDYV